ncbi:MAG TPA: hypothetical protein VNX88_05070 [Terriglobales bacterium]|nr:hypothetical protein [Terriglobales bacterium]
MSNKFRLILIICASLLLALVSNFANWDTRPRVTLLIPGGGPLGHPMLMTVVSIPTNVLHSRALVFRIQIYFH